MGGRRLTHVGVRLADADDVACSDEKFDLVSISVAADVWPEVY